MIVAVIVAYFLSVAVVFAGMILTPTAKSRKADTEYRERASTGLEWELEYLGAKFYVAIIWPWFYGKSLWEDRRKNHNG